VSGALGAGIAAWVAYEAAHWPDVARLARDNPERTAFIERYQERRRAAGRSDGILWDWVPEERISPHLKRAVVAAEDMEFFSHHGFSSAELKDALTEALRKLEAPRGASTITQQLAKNLWLSPSRNPLRKLKEAILTRQLERHLTKRRILELYLNVVEFGPGIYGAEAAARHYFGKRASDLSQHQAAELAASLPRPATWHPGRESGPYRRYVMEVERRMGVATFLWRAIGAEPVAAAPPVAVNLDSMLAMLRDTLGQVALDTMALPADSGSAQPLLRDGDSVIAVQAAMSALLAVPGAGARELVVARFARDSAGYVIDLVAAKRPDPVIASGGGVVRVATDGSVRIVRLRP
jgi:monofunctional biosynthetic peptidoglycan transglycosylase